MRKVIIKPMPDDAWPDVVQIYEARIATGNATFEKQAPEWEVWDKNHRKDCRLVAKIEGRVVGWASLSNVSSRSVYSGVTEISIYVHPRHRGRGIGDKLIIEMIIQSEQNEIWTIQAGIFPENISSINIHHKHDFRTVGIKERVGKMMIHGGT